MVWNEFSNIYDQMVVWMEDLFLGQYEKYLLYETPYSTNIF